MLTQEGLVNDGIAWDASLDSEESIYANTSIEQHDESNSSGYDADAKRAQIVKNNSNIIFGIQDMDPNRGKEEHDDVDNEQEHALFTSLAINLKWDVENCTKITQTLHMLLPKEDSVNSGKQSLGFENQNDGENPYVLSKAKDLTPSLYEVDKMGQDSYADHKIISKEELESAIEKRIHSSSGMETHEESSMLESSVVPLLPSPMHLILKLFQKYDSTVEELIISTFKAFLFTRRVSLKLPPNITLLLPQGTLEASSTSLRVRSTASKLRVSFIGSSYHILVTMTKVIKKEFEKLESLKTSDDSFACNTSLEIFHKEFNRMSGMDNDLFTYEVEIPRLASVPYDLINNGSLYEEYIMDLLARGDDEVELTHEESSDFDDEDEVAKIFRIDTNVFDFETPMCRAFKEFNYLLRINPDGLTKDIKGFKTHEDYKDDWIYEWKEDAPWQDLEWYEALKDDNLKDEALKNKAIMEGIIDEDDESSNEGRRRWDGYENTIHDHEERENEEEH
nr:hypothetical protein [Tanacetum cinerariifolium]